MEGFVVTRWKKRYEEGIGQLLKWVKEVSTRKENRHIYVLGFVCLIRLFHAETEEGLLKLPFCEQNLHLAKKSLDVVE